MASNGQLVNSPRGAGRIRRSNVLQLNPPASYAAAVTVHRKASTQQSAERRFAKGAAMKSKLDAPFNAEAFLDSVGVGRRIIEYRRGDVIFTQGDPCDS